MVSDIKYKNKILELSMLLNEAQRPIQVLDAVKWGPEIEDFLIKTNFKEIPKVNAKFYQDKPLKYDPQIKLEEFSSIRLKIKRELGETDPLGQILTRNCLQYEDVVRMLMARGTKDFYTYSKKLYGSPNEILNDGKTRLSSLANMMSVLLLKLEKKDLGLPDKKDLTAEMVVDELQNRLNPYFGNDKIKIKLSDGIISDASAGSDYIKIKKGTLFSQRDLRIFEVHEGWVHLGTTINGDQQPYAKWLSKGPPCSTITQEGLAVTMELFNFALFPRRAKRLNDRLLACKIAEEGADVLEVINFFREEGLTDQEAIKNAGRIFRGAPLTGGSPFTKDIAYLKGFVEVYNFMRSTVKEGRSEYIPFLFAGKVTLDDLPVLYEYYQKGVIAYPKHLPHQIRDMNGLAIWMAFSNFLNRMKLDDILVEKNHRKNFAA
jgi:uncharacterized protein (TIGR02421 family)